MSTDAILSVKTGKNMVVVPMFIETRDHVFIFFYIEFMFLGEVCNKFSQAYAKTSGKQKKKSNKYRGKNGKHLPL